MFAPVLFFALVAAVDLGLAEYERMTIDHILRAGAQSAMVDQGQAQVLKVLQNTASKNFTVSTQTLISADELKVDVVRFCACPDSTSVAVACLTTCTGSKPTFIYYRMSGAKLHNGMFVTGMTLNPSVQVQVR
jgi:pilus assembly protein CpaE